MFGACDHARTRVYKRTEYVHGIYYRDKLDSIFDVNTKVDIFYLKERFDLSYKLPYKIVDKSKRNQKESNWQAPNGKKDYQENWENTYTYDSLGRLINFSYSGCFICSSFPYDFDVIYNPEGQITEIRALTNGNTSFRFYYNQTGDIVRYEEYWSDELMDLVELLD